MAQVLEEWYKQMPVITRSYLTLSFLTTAGCALELISPFSIYFNRSLIFSKLQLWRLFTNFFFFGNLGLDFLFHMFFLVRYCKLLEEGSFRGRTADFFYMLLFGGTLLTAVTAIPNINIQFLGSSLTFMMVYVWGRRNPNVQMSFLGLFNFSAPYLPWVLLVFSFMVGGSSLVDLLGMGVGHIYYFLEDVYPFLSVSGRRLGSTSQMSLSISRQLAVHCHRAICAVCCKVWVSFAFALFLVEEGLASAPIGVKVVGCCALHLVRG
eukprot:jgi/Mesvir1/1686/Mv21148-RA.1